MFPNDKNPGTQTPGAVSNNAQGKPMNNMNSMAHTHSPSNPSPNNNPISGHGGKMNQGGPGGGAGGGMNMGRAMPPHNEWRTGPPPPYHPGGRNMGMNMNMNMGMGMGMGMNMNMQDPHHHPHSHPGHHGSPNAHGHPHPPPPQDGMPYDDHDSYPTPGGMPPHDPNVIDRDPQEGYAHAPHHAHGIGAMDAHDHDGGMNPMMYGRQPPSRGPHGYGPPRGAPNYMWDSGHNMHMGGGGPGNGPGPGPGLGNGGPPNGPGGSGMGAGGGNGPVNGGGGGGNPNNRPPSGYDDLVAAEACLNLAQDANDDYPYSNRGGPPPPMQWSPNSASRNNSGGPGPGPGGPMNMQYYPDMYGHGGPRGYHPNSGMPYPGFSRHMGGPFGPPGMDSGYPNGPGMSNFGMPPDEYSRMPMMHQYPHDYPMHPNARQKMDGMMPQAYGGTDSMNTMNHNSMMTDSKNTAKGASKRPLTDVLAGTKSSDSNKKGGGKGKRPADMPRRPLSAYNFFFSEERERVLASLSDKEEGEGGPTDSAADTADVDTDALKSIKDEADGAASKDIDDKKDTQENQNDGDEDVKIEGEDKNDKENDEHGEQPDASETASAVTDLKSDPNHQAASERLLKLRDNPDVARRPHRKTHGKIGFKDLARLIGQRWRALPEAEKERYKDMAEKDLARYKEQMHLYHNQGKWAVLQIKLQNSSTEDASSHAKTNIGNGINSTTI